ncbi:hypothetical protein Acr_03g0015550 [Actinidia rufa]|uniref:Bifunctional inhibitor/lipid-transfer protein/seed storage 2S albumin superfamily protein n=1 Tax=Actinidia rufa TaxID=165716 RepID=A0A7J0EE70_9ERIC|nr:hypothetical protein Acr_03g0015550 [Actinidia rufa]
MKKVSCNVALMTVAVVVLLGEAGLTEAVVCNPIELLSCVLDIVFAKPSNFCCDTLKEQEPCLCQDLKDPNIAKFFKNPNSKKIATACVLPTDCGGGGSRGGGGEMHIRSYIPCVDFFMTKPPLSKLCCDTMKELELCLCRPKIDTGLRLLLTKSPVAKKVATDCGVALPPVCY